MSSTFLKFVIKICNIKPKLILESFKKLCKVHARSHHVDSCFWETVQEALIYVERNSPKLELIIFWIGFAFNGIQKRKRIKFFFVFFLTLLLICAYYFFTFHLLLEEVAGMKLDAVIPKLTSYCVESWNAIAKKCCNHKKNPSLKELKSFKWNNWCEG